MKNFIVAKSAGFCFGVSRSVEMAQQLLENGSAYSLGQLIHNDDVVRKFEDQGLKVVNSPDELPAGARVMIRSHGVSKAVYAQLEERGQGCPVAQERGHPTADVRAESEIH